MPDNSCTTCNTGGEVPLLEGPKPEGSSFEGYYMGGGPGEPGWYPPEAEPEPDVVEGTWEDITQKKTKEERLIDEMSRWARDHGFKEPTTYQEALGYQQQKRYREEILEEQRRTALEEIKSKRRKYRREYRPQVGKWIKTYLKPQPRTELTKIFFPGKALRDTYVPGPPVKTTLAQIKAIREVSTPDMGPESTLGQSVITHSESLKIAGSPPPAVRVKTPARDPEKFEGLGSALVRLRNLGTFTGVEQAVLTEVAGNGDVDIPSHVRKEVGRLGFSRKEVDSSLKRLRDLGFLVPSGRVQDGEQELMLSGGSHG